ncbi:MAG TPA: ABC transporter ATP-binding protein [Candidatus Hydrogenedentes bacterium]|nr:ABC transporter ATP-binding protein [Candidatus Hydrogenedentota bacterium]
MSSCFSNGSPVVIEDLSRKFWRKQALEHVSLEIPRGCVFGLVGENGAGKTTLVKHLMGLLKAQSGKVRVFGMDPVNDPEGVLARVGYLSENRDLPDWMRVRELILFTRAFFPQWDDAYAEELRDLFGLDPVIKIRNLSRGQRAQMGLLVALAHRPDLLILDEPSSGLDAVVRHDILSAIIRTVADEGRTVLFSSHLLDEVEYVADHVAFLHEGRLAFSAPLADIKAEYRLFTLHFDTPPPQPPLIETALTRTGAGLEWTFLTQGDPDIPQRAAAQFGASVVDAGEPSLEEIFVARVRGKRTKLAGISVASVKEG